MQKTFYETDENLFGMKNYDEEYEMHFMKKQEKKQRKQH